ncbi:HAD-superfamily hydrolase [Xylariaceae sp. FL0594]|nr:HAD-superfamily hydrolase [Xylariaceae sp. FL0594]
MALATEKNVAFAFDVDGVLLRGTEPIPGAARALKRLQEQNIPFIFLTNGGGLTEKAHVARLEQRLGLSLSAAQMVQSHSPFHDLQAQYWNQTILVLGGHGDVIRNLAFSYGFGDVLTSSDFFIDYPNLHPFPEITGFHHVLHGRRSRIQVAAILVWSSPRDWCMDLQLIKDLLLSDGGRVGTRDTTNGTPSLPNCGYQLNGVKLFFSNPDFEWATAHNLPRLAQGAFIAALKGIWAEETKGQAELQYSVVGKPCEQTFKYAERKLVRYSGAIRASADRYGSQVDTVYMVGDNPASDIAGILVETGVHIADTTPSHAPCHTAPDVLQAVDWVLEMHGLARSTKSTKEGKRRMSFG